MATFTLGLVGGSGLLKAKLDALKCLADEYVDTPHGRVFLRAGRISEGVDLVFVQRHDASATRTYTQPADVNYAAIALALKAKGCDAVVGTCSVGSLKSPLPVSSLVVPDDFYCPADLRRVYSDYRAHLMPVLDERVRNALLDTLRGAGHHPVPHGTYVNSRGPRFETKAEIRQMAVAGDLVGMTAAHECSACTEVGLPYAMLCLVDNFANGVAAELTIEMFHAAQAANLAILESCVRAVLGELPTRLAPLLADKKKEAKEDEHSHSHSHASSASGAASSPAVAAAASSSCGDTPLPSPVPSSPAPGVPVHVDLLVHARYVVPLAAGREQQVLDHHSVAVLKGRIVDILPTAAARSRYAAVKTVTLDASHAVMPGLINAHTHLAMNLMRGVADDLPLAQWLTEQIWPTEARLVSPEFVAAGAEAAMAELIRSGVTCINEMYWFPAATAEVVERVGMRATVGGVIMEFPSSYAGNAGEYMDKGFDVLARFVPGGAAAAAAAGFKVGPAPPPAPVAGETGAAATGGAGAAPPAPVRTPAAEPSGRVRYALAPHAPYTVSDATFEKVRDASAALGIKVHVHLHETEGEVTQSKTGAAGSTKHLSESLCSPVENLERLGLLNERLIAVHMTQLSDSEIESVARAGASVVHCPNSNLKLASGFCPVAKLIKAGVNVALGTDSASSNNSLDFFQEMKLAAVLAKGVASDATAVPAWQALRMATLNGAMALGIEADAGSLEVGKYADMVAVDLGSLETQPLFSVHSHLVYAASRANVTDVWVNGSQLLDARRLTTIDEAACLRSIAKWAEAVRPGRTAADKHAHLDAADAKHAHTAQHGKGEEGKVHAASDKK